MILLDLTKVFDRAVLQSSWSCTSLKPEVWRRMLRVASTNGVRPAADLGSLILSLKKAFDGLDNCEERIVTAEDIIIREEIDDDTEWLTDCQWIERQKLGDFHDPFTGSVTPLGFISSTYGNLLDPDIRGGARCLFASVACIWAKVVGLDTNLEPSVLASFAAEAVKSCSWPLGFTGPWDPTSNRVMEFDT